jgi:hypothetical protein
MKPHESYASGKAEHMRLPFVYISTIFLRFWFEFCYVTDNAEVFPFSFLLGYSVTSGTEISFLLIVIA